MASQWNKNWKRVGQRSQAQSLRHERNETSRQRQQKANLKHVKQQLRVKTARFKLAEGARKYVATKFRTQTQVIPRREGASTRSTTTSKPTSLAAHEHQFQVNKGKAGELAKLINKPVVDSKVQVPENAKAQTTTAESKQVVPQPQATRVPDKGKKGKTTKRTRGETKAKAKVKAGVKAGKNVKQVKPEAKLTDAKRASQAGVAAAAVTVKGQTDKKGESKLEKKGKESSLTENVGKKQAGRLKKLSDGGGSAQADVNVNVTAKGSEEWQPSESDAIAAKETKSRYEFGKDERFEVYSEPGPSFEGKKKASELSHKVLQPKVANAARINERVTEQLEKIALSKKIDTDDPELKELFSKCRISSGGPYGGMHA